MEYDYIETIKYYGSRFDYEELVQDIENMLSMQGKEFNEVKSLLNYFKKSKENFNELKTTLEESCFYSLFEDGYISKRDSLETILIEVIKEYGLNTFLYELFSDSDLCDYIQSLGLQFGTVGYSSWSYYLAFEGESCEYIRNLYEGYDFYAICELDEDGEVIDSLGMCYIQNDEDLKHLLSRNFDIKGKEVFLIDNEESEYFNAFPKVKKVVSGYKFVAV